MQLSCFVQRYLVGAPCGLFAALSGTWWMVVLDQMALLPTKSTCISSVLGHALSPEGQLVIMPPLVVDEGQQPHVRVLAMVLQWFARSLSALAFAKCRVLIEMDCLH